MRRTKTSTTLPTMREEEGLRAAGYTAIAGLDEVGRGPIAGPVFAGAVILPDAITGDWKHLVRDSKQLTARQRETVLPQLAEAAIAIATGSASPAEVDRLGIVPAVRLAMMRAINDLSLAPDYLLLDAFPLPESRLPQKAIVKGDALCTSIAAASIAAKVERDRVMRDLDSKFPGYGFASHKGYGSAGHMAALAELGPCEVHRITFAPVRAQAEARGMFGDRLIRFDVHQESKVTEVNAVASDFQPGLTGLGMP
jgi:ribonuclease HII